MLQKQPGQEKGNVTVDPEVLYYTKLNTARAKDKNLYTT
jgi:hypothetical protein